MSNEIYEGNGRGQRSFDINSHIEAVESNIKSLDSVDICLIFLHLDSFTFNDKFKDWIKKYQKATGADPEFDLVFIIDDLGENDEIKKGNLKRLKAIKENSFMRKFIKKITVKGANRDSVVGLEPNVFASDVRFEELK